MNIAILMQQSVEAMSRMRDQSMIYGQSMGRVPPNQPLYTSITLSFQGNVPSDTVTPMDLSSSANDGENEDSKQNQYKSKSTNSASLSMFEVIDQMSNAQDGPGGAAETPTALNVHGRRQSQPVLSAIVNPNVGHGTVNVMSSPIVAEQERLIQQQQQLLALQQQALKARSMP